MRCWLVCIALAATAFGCAPPELPGVEARLSDVQVTLSGSPDRVTADGSFMITLRRPGDASHAGRVMVDAVTSSGGALPRIEANHLDADIAFPLELAGDQSVTFEARFSGSAATTSPDPWDAICDGTPSTEGDVEVSVRIFDELGAHMNTHAVTSGHELVVTDVASVTDERVPEAPILTQLVESDWALQLGSDGEDRVLAMSVDDAGTTALALSVGTLLPFAGTDVHGDRVAVIDAAGQPLWSALLDDTSAVAAVDGEVWAAGKESSRWVLAHHDALGQRVSTTTLREEIVVVTSVAVAPDRSVLIVAAKRPEMEPYSTMVFMLNPDGTERWALPLDAWWTHGFIDRQGGIWLHGSFDLPLDFGDEVLDASRINGSFVARLEMDGSVSFTRDTSHCGTSPATTRTPSDTLVLVCYGELEEIDATGTSVRTSTAHLAFANVGRAAVDDRNHLFATVGQDLVELDEQRSEVARQRLGCGDDTTLAAAPNGSTVVLAHTGTGPVPFADPPPQSVGGDDIFVAKLR